jgi:hypothetical protein
MRYLKPVRVVAEVHQEVVGSLRGPGSGFVVTPSTWT